MNSYTPALANQKNLQSSGLCGHWMPSRTVFFKLFEVSDWQNIFQLAMY